MYPLTSWSYEQLCQRLDTLIDHGLHAEAVVGSCQVAEQVILRVLVRAINQRRKIWDVKGRALIDVAGASHRDELLKLYQGPEHWKTARGKMVASESLHIPLLADAFNSVVDHCKATSVAPWEVFQAKTYLQASSSDPSHPLRYSLRKCRHSLVHGLHSPPARELEILGSWGCQMAKNLLHPTKGWPATLGWNPQSRLPALRRIKNA